MAIRAPDGANKHKRKIQILVCDLAQQEGRRLAECHLTGLLHLYQIMVLVPGTSVIHHHHSTSDDS